jgi:glycosyltransferase involved in cell wall biosynthesis
VKLAVVVQRYGADINGGAELHARYIAERLARHASVEVITTCARDYVTWRNEISAGVETVNGVAVRRFPVSRERSPDDFGRYSVRVFNRRHSIADEIAWLEKEGPTSPALIGHLERSAAGYDFILFFSYRYYLAWHGARRVSPRAVLVPTAERDAAMGLAIFPPVFRGVRAVMYNSHEERAMIHGAAGNQEVPGVVVGVGSDVPERTDPGRFRTRFNMPRPFAIYVGRIDENKGCGELFDYFERYAATFPRGLDLVLIGSAVMPVPKHPRIHHLGFVDDRDKFDAMAAADLLIMPSYFESLSMVTLEAWALGRPVLANGRCDVLKGQCIRSGAGLYYESYEEFAETLYSLESNGPLNARLGRNGREYFTRHYAWPVIERKYLAMFERLQREPAARAMEPLPGWFARRRRDVPAAADVLASLPAGAVVPEIRAEPTAVPDEDRRVSDRWPERRHHDTRYRGRHDRRGTRRA